ncbi:hypothetical protein DER44DRAFT_797056, partial [Fusarium oxysporum]
MISNQCGMHRKLSTSFCKQFQILSESLPRNWFRTRDRLHKQRSSFDTSAPPGTKELLTNWMRCTRRDETLDQARRDMVVALSEMPLTT